MKEMTPEMAEAMKKVYQPLIDAINGLTVDEIVLAMEGFHATTEDNCPWYAYALNHTLPPMLAIIGYQKDGYHDAWFRYTEAERAKRNGGSK